MMAKWPVEPVRGSELFCQLNGWKRCSMERTTPFAAASMEHRVVMRVLLGAVFGEMPVSPLVPFRPVEVSP